MLGLCLEVGESVEIIIGKIVAARGMYVDVRVHNRSMDLAICKWKGNERGLLLSLKIVVKDKRAEKREKGLLC